MAAVSQLKNQVASLESQLSEQKNGPSSSSSSSSSDMVKEVMVEIYTNFQEVFESDDYKDDSFAADEVRDWIILLGGWDPWDGGTGFLGGSELGNLY